MTILSRRRGRARASAPAGSWRTPPRRCGAAGHPIAAARRRAAGRPRLRSGPGVAARPSRGRARGRRTPSALRGWIERRAAGEPIAYIRGFKEWLLAAHRDRCARPDPAARDGARWPRPPSPRSPRGWSRDGEPVPPGRWPPGAAPLPLALALRFRTAMALGRLRLVASDISPEALELAAENLAAHGVARPGHARLRRPAGARRRLARPRADLLIANLPYVPSAEVDARARVACASSRGSRWTAARTGSTCCAACSPTLPLQRRPAATVVLEMGVDQVDAVRAAARPADRRVRVGACPTWPGSSACVRIELPHDRPAAGHDRGACAGGRDPGRRRAGGLPDRHRLRRRAARLAARRARGALRPQAARRRKARPDLVSGLGGRATPGWLVGRPRERPRRALLAWCPDPRAAARDRADATQAFRVPDHPVALALHRGSRADVVDQRKRQRRAGHPRMPTTC